MRVFFCLKFKIKIIKRRRIDIMCYVFKRDINKSGGFFKFNDVVTPILRFSKEHIIEYVWKHGNLPQCINE